MHTAAVRAVYDRVFNESSQPPLEGPTETPRTGGADDETERLIRQAAARLCKAVGDGAPQFPGDDSRMEHMMACALPRSINPLRSLRCLMAWAESLATYSNGRGQASSWTVRTGEWPTLIERLIPVLSSQYLSHLLVSRPLLATALVEDGVPSAIDFARLMRNAVDNETDPNSKPDALRRAWYRLVIGIGYRDMCVVDVAGEQSSGGPGKYNPAPEPLSPALISISQPSLRFSAKAQTALAEAVLRIASEIALESIGVPDIQPNELPFTILGLGRLGHAGMDYGSDLDLLVVFDDDEEWPPTLAGKSIASVAASASTPQEFYAKLATRIVRVLSSITREGLLYRSDLRLRPEGKSGPVALALGGLVAYLTNRASAWEHSAYLKAREVAGNLRFGERARIAICDASFDAASRNQSLLEELREMRARQVKEKAGTARPNIKWGPGGMSDVYFVTRYLQLRDRIYFPPEQGTTALITHLGDVGALDEVSARTLFEGYAFQRRLDHWMRLLLERPDPMLPASSVALGDLTRALGLPSVSAFEAAFAHHTASIRGVYDHVFG